MARRKTRGFNDPDFGDRFQKAVSDAFILSLRGLAFEKEKAEAKQLSTLRDQQIAAGQRAEEEHVFKTTVGRRQEEEMREAQLESIKALTSQRQRAANLRTTTDLRNLDEKRFGMAVNMAGQDPLFKWKDASGQLDAINQAFDILSAAKTESQKPKPTVTAPPNTGAAGRGGKGVTPSVNTRRVDEAQKAFGF